MLSRGQRRLIWQRRQQSATSVHFPLLLLSFFLFFFVFFVFFSNTLIRSCLSHGGSLLDSNRVGLIDFSCSCRLEAAASNCAEYPGSSLPALFLSVFYFASKKANDGFDLSTFCFTENHDTTSLYCCRVINKRSVVIRLDLQYALNQKSRWREIPSMKGRVETELVQCWMGRCFKGMMVGWLNSAYQREFKGSDENQH